MGKDFYGYVKVPVPKGHIKLSPSGLSEFYRNKKGWYDKTILNISDFAGNYATNQGTLLHGIAEGTFLKMPDEEYWELSEKYLNGQAGRGVITKDEISQILEFVRGFKPVLEDWLIYKDPHKVIEVETVVDYQIRRAKGQTVDFHLAGSIDAIVSREMVDDNGDTYTQYGIRDYKSAKRKISSIESYRDQLSTYALATSKTRGFDISFIEVVALVWNKTNGYTVTSLVSEINPDLDYKPLTKTIRQIVKTYEASLQHPELQPLLFPLGVDFMGKPIN